MCYNIIATQVNSFDLSMGKYYGKRCFLSLLMPIDRKSLCRNNEGSTFAGAPLIEGRISVEGEGQTFGPLEWRDDSIAAASN